VKRASDGVNWKCTNGCVSDSFNVNFWIRMIVEDNGKVGSLLRFLPVIFVYTWLQAATVCIPDSVAEPWLKMSAQDFVTAGTDNQTAVYKRILGASVVMTVQASIGKGDQVSMVATELTTA
jgi:hypothetical protein